MFRGRLWQTGQEFCISVGAALAVLKDVVERGKKRAPPGRAAHCGLPLADGFEHLVIRKDVELRDPKVALKAFNGQDNAASFQVERGRVSRNRG